MAYTVKEVPRVWITVADGTRLAAALWVPTADSDATSTRETFPAILGEYMVKDDPLCRVLVQDTLLDLPQLTQSYRWVPVSALG